MAFDQKQARTARAAIVLAGIAIVAVAALVAVVGFGVGAPAAGDAASSPEDTVDMVADAAAASEADSHTVDDIDAEYGTATSTLISQYEADPSNPSALVNLANGYFDWGVAVMNHAADAADDAHAAELFQDAIGYYDKYLEGNPGARSAAVDRAICVFYAGDTQAAIADLEELTAEDASFAPAWANLGMFYEAAGSTDQAADAYRRAIDAAGEDDAYSVVDYAQGRLEALGQ